MPATKATGNMDKEYKTIGELVDELSTYDRDIKVLVCHIGLEDSSTINIMRGKIIRANRDRRMTDGKPSFKSH